MADSEEKETKGKSEASLLTNLTFVNFLRKPQCRCNPALGFVETVGQCDGSGGPGLLWTEKFWESLMGDVDWLGDGTPDTVEEAANYATWELYHSDYKNYKGWDSWLIQGEYSLTLASASTK